MRVMHSSWIGSPVVRVLLWLMVAVGCSGCLLDLRSPIDDTAVTSLVRARKLQQVVVEQTPRSTIIMGEASVHIVCYGASQDASGFINDGVIQLHVKDTTQVFVLPGNHYKTRVVCVYVSDERLRRATQFIEVQFHDGSSVRKPIQGVGAIFTRETLFDIAYTEVRLYDADGRVMFVVTRT